MRAALAFSKHATKDALVYYALSLPAIVAEAIFSVAITSNPGVLASQGAPNGALVTLVRFLPWLFLLASVYAVFVFRPSILVSLLVASFFIAASVSSTITFVGARFGLADVVFLVIAASFLALAGFSYARSVKLLGGRQVKLTSSGPVGYQVLGIALESVLPLVAALALVALVEAVVGALGVQAALLPQPLSSLASLYLETRVGLVFTTLLVAGATIWVLRQVLEPIILHFTLTGEDAKKELLSEIEPTTKMVRKFVRYRPSRGLAWGVLGLAYCFGMVGAMAAFLPHQEFYNGLAGVFDPRAASPSPAEQFSLRSFENLTVRADIAFAQVEDYIRAIIRLLWG
ncbi:MAG: hypothetical protein OK455_03550 [Thaumarchaeota archaeon]|nr:hypothetical protein [Nitrososphaerota archaeon]